MSGFSPGLSHLEQFGVVVLQRNHGAVATHSSKANLNIYKGNAVIEQGARNARRAADASSRRMKPCQILTLMPASSKSLVTFSFMRPLGSARRIIGGSVSKEAPEPVDAVGDGTDPAAAAIVAIVCCGLCRRLLGWKVKRSLEMKRKRDVSWNATEWAWKGKPPHIQNHKPNDKPIHVDVDGSIAFKASHYWFQNHAYPWTPIASSIARPIDG